MGVFEGARCGGASRTKGNDKTVGTGSTSPRCQAGFDGSLAWD